MASNHRQARDRLVDPNWRRNQWRDHLQNRTHAALDQSCPGHESLNCKHSGQPTASALLSGLTREFLGQFPQIESEPAAQEPPREGGDASDSVRRPRRRNPEVAVRLGSRSLVPRKFFQERGRLVEAVERRPVRLHGKVCGEVLVHIAKSLLDFGRLLFEQRDVRLGGAAVVLVHLLLLGERSDSGQAGNGESCEREAEHLD
mmetsp:Transcript_25837/g.65129  ORF Transcript_25837/g.65129 Transcript_25837/m.65129 type:complete len:202 (-) Transcript_25837:111-716(-)